MKCCKCKSFVSTLVSSGFNQNVMLLQSCLLGVWEGSIAAQAALSIVLLPGPAFPPLGSCRVWD